MVGVRSAEPGFTLLEVLVSIAITAMLVTAGFTAFRGINRTQERARLEANRASSARVLLDRIESELLGTMLLAKRPFRPRLRHPWVFIGEDRVFGTNDSDALRFITSNPARPPGAQSEVGIRMVTYAVGGIEDEDRLALYRSEQRLPTIMRKRIELSLAAPVMHDVASLRIRYLAEDGWRDRWDSTDVSQLDELPTAIEISLQLYEKQRGGDEAPGPVYTRTVPIPMRPISQDTVAALDASCPGGVTVRGCLLRLGSLIKRIGKPLRDAITGLRRATPDRCWAADPGSAQLEALKEGLRSALPRNPEELCQ